VVSPESALSVIDGVGALTAIEQRIPQIGFAWLAAPAAPTEAEPIAEPLEAVGPLAVPAAPTEAKPVAESLEAPEQAAPMAAEEGGQYGPIAPNERLWTIAAKLRPDPSINTPIMMQALFMANPQAFSQGDMNYLKVDAILRIPTLREIVDYTGSRAALELLELKQQNHSPPAPANGEGEGHD
jgi:FimV-like protein